MKSVLYKLRLQQADVRRKPVIDFSGKIILADLARKDNTGRLSSGMYSGVRASGAVDFRPIPGFF